VYNIREWSTGGRALNWLYAFWVVVAAVVVAPFLLAKTPTMRIFLAGVLAFGIVCGVVEQYIAGGLHLRGTILEILGGGVGWASIYIVIATAIVQPWRRRPPEKRPAYVACSIVLVVFTIISLGGGYSLLAQ
jgi:hypothetical protein